MMSERECGALIGPEGESCGVAKPCPEHDGPRVRKPWERTWKVSPLGLGDDSGDLVALDELGAWDDADARLAASAPDLVRALLRVEWGGDQSIGVCPDCDARELHGHADGCGLAAALRKAGVIE